MSTPTVVLTSMDVDIGVVKLSENDNQCAV